MLRNTVQYALVGLVAFVAFNYLDELFVYIGEPVYVDSVFGRLKGRVINVRGGKEVYSFTNVPYAKAPVDELRFKPPVAYGKWEDDLDATKPIKLCLQYDTLWKRLDGTEDCLNLQIYTKNVDKSKPLRPVMVWFHGGHFMYGGNNINGPDYLLEKEDILLVAVNYRLNSLGFLSTGDSIAPGNNGLRDQNLALKWIQTAISDFGGDANQVTLFGCSAGGASVSYHILSPMSKGLFHRAISQSGSSLCPWAFTRDPKRQAIRLANKLGCTNEASKSSSDLVKCLQQIPAKELVSVHEEMRDVFHEVDAVFGPTIEVATKDKEGTFLPDSPYELYKTGQFSRVPWITGVTSEEGCFRSSLIYQYEDKISKANEKWTEIMPRALLLYNDDPTLTEKIKSFYFGIKKKAVNQISTKGEKTFPVFGKEDLEGLTNIYSDRYFVGCVRDAAVLHSKYAPTYAYYYTNKHDISYGTIMEMTPGNIPVPIEILIGYTKYLLYRHVLKWDLTDYGVCHTDEMQSLFKLSPLLNTDIHSPQYEFSKSMVNLWTSFAIKGKPDAFGGINWLPLSGGKKNSTTVEPPKYLRLGKVPAMIEEPFTERLEFWRNLNLPQN